MVCLASGLVDLLDGARSSTIHSALKVLAIFSFVLVVVLLRGAACSANARERMDKETARSALCIHEALILPTDVKHPRKSRQL